MNKQRRAEIAKLTARADEMIDPMEEWIADMQTQLDEEQEVYDSMPESFQNGEKGEAAQRAIDSMKAAIDAMDSAKSSIEDASIEANSASE